MGLLGVTFIVLLILKLTGNFEYSWWWVFAPLNLWCVLVTVWGVFVAINRRK